MLNEATGIAQAAAPTAAIVTSATRTWNDANGNFEPDCVLTALVENGECGQVNNLRFGTPVITRRFDPAITSGFAVRPYNWQASATLQHELRPGIGITAGYFRTWYGNFMATQNLAVTAADFDPYCVTAPTDPRLKLLQDGMRTNNSQSGNGGLFRWFLTNQAQVQEVTLETGGILAESETGGIQVNAVPKDGGNPFRSTSAPAAPAAACQAAMSATR